MKNRKILIAMGGVIFLLALLLFLFLVVWKKEYTITFDSDGGTPVLEQKVKENHLATKPEDPIKDGYEFVDWYYENQVFSFDTKITKDYTLKAKWKETITLSVKTMNLMIGSEGQLEILKLSDGIEKKDLIWTSSDESIAKIDENGKVSALKEGTAIITVKTKDGKYKVSCKIMVTKEKIEIEKIEIKGESTVNVGSTLKLSVLVTPENATTEEVTWKSSDLSIAKVDSHGNVTGLKAGTVTITATTKNGKTATKEIYIKENTSSSEESKEQTPNQEPTTKPEETQKPTPSTPDPPKEETPKEVSVESVAIDQKDQTMYVNDTLTLTASVLPSNATNKNVTWESSDPAVASIDNLGIVTAKSKGTTIITVRTQEGNKEAKITITVKNVYEITLTPKPLEMGGTIQYSVSLTENGNPINFLAYDYKGYKQEPRIDAGLISKDITSITVLLENNEEVTATVIYK